jgi:signal transduction histidine kinase
MTILAVIVDAIGLVRNPLAELNFLVPFGVVFGVLILSLVFIGIRVLRRFSMPLDELLEAADRISQGDYSTRVREGGPPEVRRLSETFNTMASRLQSIDQQRRTLFADITHELRTPLTIIQGTLEGIQDGLYPPDGSRLKSLLDETRILSRLINDLKTLALAESGSLILKREPTNINRLIQEAVNSYSAEARAAGINFKLSLTDFPSAEVDPIRVQEILGNLLANAIHNTASGGRIEVGTSMSNTLSNNEIQIVIADTGRGIPVQDLPYIFERYYKSGDSGGMGLGLAIVKTLVEAHGGRITAASKPGKGTRIVFTIPA